VGGAGNDLLVGGAGNDYINLAGGGRDVVSYENTSLGDPLGGNGTDTVANFTLGSGADRDMVDLAHLLSGFTSTGSAAGDAAALVNGGFVNLQDSGGNLLLQVDQDGGGTYQTLAVLIQHSMNEINGASTQDKLATLLGDGNLDVGATYLTGSSIIDGATGVATTSNLVLNFSGDVKLNTGTIKFIDDNNQAISIDVTNSAGQLSVTDNQLTINPSVDFAANTHYHVEIAASAVLDSSGHAFAGIVDNTTLDFHTGS